MERTGATRASRWGISAAGEHPFVQLGLVALGAAALLWPAFVNGYPLVFQDTAWYLSPFLGTGRHHPGHTIGYSLFTALVPGAPSLWSIAVAQALITSALIVRVASAAAEAPRERLFLPAAALLGVLLLSGAAKYVSWVMADVSTGWLFLAGALFLMSAKRLDRAAAALVAALAVLSHNTHVPIAIATSAGLAAGAWLLPAARSARRASLVLLLLALLSVPWTFAVNSMLRGTSRVFQGTGTMLMYRFIDSGVVLPTLDRYCGERAWKSCRHRDEFARHVGRADGWFLHRPSSPFLGELGGWNGAEQGEIVAHAFRCCWDRIALTTAAAAWRQFWRIDSDDGLAIVDTGPALAFLKRHHASELPALDSSRQGRGERVRVLLHPFPEVALHALTILVAGGLAAYAWRRGRREVAFLVAGALLFVLANALVCGFGSSVHDRYQGRVAWLVPLAAALAGGRLVAARASAPPPAAR
jgi:hypothetical protein